MSSKQQHDIFHLATKKQLQHIKDGLHRISPHIWDCLGEETLNIYIRYDQYVEVFLVPKHLERNLRFIRNLKLLQHTGIYFGFLKGPDFLLSLEGAEFIFQTFYKSKRLKLKTITATTDGAKSFLYGNVLKLSEFAQAPQSLNRKDVIFVLNPKEQFIGIGYIFKRDDRTELRNLVDYGYYIRRGH
jgi:ribosome biogenesis protein Nip4